MPLPRLTLRSLPTGLLVIAPPLLMGCAELRTHYAPATGAPMDVFDQTVVRHGVQQVATGQSELRDAQGNLIATRTHYENQPISWEERTWYPMQGRMRLDDESFYRITGDQEATGQYDAWHHGGVTKNTIGWVMLGVGLAVLGGGIGMYAADQGNASTTGATALSTVGYIGMTAGAITAGVGAFLIIAGRHAAAAVDARLIDDPERMKADAERYNQQLASAAPPPVAATAAAPVQAAPPISIEPFTASMTGGRITRVELKADGGIWANGKLIGVLAGADVKDTSGNTLFSVFSDGTISGAGLGASIRVKLTGNLLDMGGKQMALADDGSIAVINHGAAQTIGRISRGARNARTVTLVLFAVNALAH